MDIIDSLLEHTKWQEFLAHKLTKSHLSKVEETSLIDFVENKKYVDICKCIVASTYTFSIPKKTTINKSGSNKKRVVYSFLEAENMVLKFISVRRGDKEALNSLIYNLQGIKAIYG